MNMVLNGLTDLKILDTLMKIDMALSSKSVRTPAFHAGNPGSNPGSVTNTLTEHGFFVRFSTTTGTQPRRPLRYAGQ